MSGSAVKVLFVSCVIEREHIGIPVEVPEYEVAVLQEIHGEMGVREVGEREIEVDGLTAAIAYAQLQSKYSGHTREVRQVYRTVRELARLSGLPFQAGDDEAVKFQEAEVRVGGAKVQNRKVKEKKPAGDDEAASE